MKTRKTTRSDGAETPQPTDRVCRQFTAAAPNALWVADLTYIRTHSGWVYAAFILDVYSRMVVGWQVSTTMHTDLALDALDMGLWARDRAGQDVAGLIHHSDRGVQYRAIRYTERLAEAEAVTSVGSKGDSYDNAMAEAFNSLFKAECIRNPIMRPRGGWGGVSCTDPAGWVRGERVSPLAVRCGRVRDCRCGGTHRTRRRVRTRWRRGGRRPIPLAGCG